MRKHQMALLCAACAALAASPASAQATYDEAPILVWSAFAPAEQALIDVMAQSFFENDLRGAQARRIENLTANIYRALPPDQQKQFRSARRAAYYEFSATERLKLRDAKTPQFDNLTDAQKLPFRRAALTLLGFPPPISEKPGAEI